MSAELRRYLVWICWNPSGRVYHYCAVAPSEDVAIDGVINGRHSAVKASGAYAWPPDVRGPRVKLDRLSGFRLKDQPTIDAVCAALNVVVSVPIGQEATPAEQSPMRMRRPAEGTIAPWRRSVR